jgi:hypothetical protein
MDTHQRVSTRILWLVAVCSLVVMLGAPDVWAATRTYSGQATVVRATVLDVTTVLSDTGPLPSSGDAREASLLEKHVDGLLDAEVLHATTIGQGDHSRSEASVANLSLTVAGNTIDADFLMARATAQCQPGGPVVSGSSEIAVLVINGQAITVTGAPNQTVLLPAGTGQVVINEQMSDGAGDITVNALHVVVNDPVTKSVVADVVIAHAHADITCGGQAACTVGTDFVTGGGWIAPSGDKDTFGVAGGIKNGALWGHLTYIDHGTGLKVKGTGVTAYTGVTGSDTRREIDGTAEINGQPGTYRVVVHDKGEPGRNDTFDIWLSNGYTAAGYLQGGNVQLHQPKCP